ncbi:hypothetical protein FTUN_8363 [Frigoriglobus tundricola]|uniref:Uncharacterized protein n=1 Tax=Frigoriglobus tundricola TaxID=2774151 RepID=A0A6M5Z5L9_9BACT|nr:hypothetical protein FTUN_8363 [Frigoriglobus tundricola]
MTSLIYALNRAAGNPIPKGLTRRPRLGISHPETVITRAIWGRRAWAHAGELHTRSGPLP